MSQHPTAATPVVQLFRSRFVRRPPGHSALLRECQAFGNGGSAAAPAGRSLSAAGLCSAGVVVSMNTVTDSTNLAGSSWKGNGPGSEDLQPGTGHGGVSHLGVTNRYDGIVCSPDQLHRNGFRQITAVQHSATCPRQSTTARAASRVNADEAVGSNPDRPIRSIVGCRPSPWNRRPCPINARTPGVGSTRGRVMPGPPRRPATMQSAVRY